MAFLTAAQCRAGRALLDWSQPELAKRCGMHVQTISNFEQGNGSPTKNTLKIISDTLENAGLAFLENEGVARKSSGVATYQGHNGFRNFILDVYDTVKTGGDVSVSNVNEADFLKWFGKDADQHFSRMRLLPNLNFRILIKEGDTNAIADYAVYRQVRKENFGNIPFYLYGEKTGFIVFEEDSVEVFVITHPQITRYFRRRFDEVWVNAKVIRI